MGVVVKVEELVLAVCGGILEQDDLHQNLEQSDLHACQGGPSAPGGGSLMGQDLRPASDTF